MNVVFTTAWEDKLLNEEEDIPGTPEDKVIKTRRKNCEWDTEDTREETGLEPLMDIEDMDIDRGETPSPSDVPAELPLPPIPEDEVVVDESEGEAPLLDSEDDAPLVEPDPEVVHRRQVAAQEAGQRERRRRKDNQSQDSSPEPEEGEIVDLREDPAPAPSSPRMLERQDGEDEGEIQDRPRRARREVRRTISKSTQAGQAAKWTKFDLGRSAQILRSMNPGTVLRE